MSEASTWARSSSEGRVIIRRAELQRLVPLSTVQIWRLEKQRAFPQRVQLGPTSVGWFLDEVQLWVESRIRAGGRPVAGRTIGSKVVGGKVVKDRPDAAP